MGLLHGCAGRLTAKNADFRPGQYALLDDDRPPPRNKIFLRACNASDPWQQWNVAPSSGNRSRISSAASEACLSSEAPQNPMETTANASACTAPGEDGITCPIFT
jgi:hypothetical protein